MHIIFNKRPTKMNVLLLWSEKSWIFKSKSGIQGTCRHLVAVFLSCRFFGWTEVKHFVCKQNMSHHVGFTSEMSTVCLPCSPLLFLAMECNGLMWDLDQGFEPGPQW